MKWIVKRCWYSHAYVHTFAAVSVCIGQLCRYISIIAPTEILKEDIGGVPLAASSHVNDDVFLPKIGMYIHITDNI